MRRLWEKEYYLRGSDFDKNNHIRPSAVLDLFQDAAGQHAVEIGVGFEAMIARSFLWVLTRVNFKILTQPKSYQKVIVKTWPLPPNRLSYRREYCIENENGEKMIVGSSDWAVIDSEKRQLVVAPDLYGFRDGFHTELMFEERIRRVPNFEISGTPHVVNPGFTELDANNHVNNTRYAAYVLDAIDPSSTEEIAAFQIDYRKEVLQGTQINVYHAKEDGVILAKGQNDDGDTMFACKLEYKK